MDKENLIENIGHIVLYQAQKVIETTGGRQKKSSCKKKRI
jgi:hypothetical protein